MSNLNIILDRYFNSFDNNKNGKLEQAEAKEFFNELFNKAEDMIPESAHSKIMDSIDKNKDGNLSKKELREIFIIAMNSVQHDF